MTPFLLPSAHRITATLLVCGLLAVVTSPIFGQTTPPTLSWGAGGAGGSGTWSTSASNVDWYNGSANVPWTNGDNAVFAGTAGTVTISGAVTTPQVTFSTAGYTIQGGFLEGSSTGLTVETDTDATISAPIFASGSYSTPFTKTGGGALTISAASEPSFFSSVNVTAGELRYASGGSPVFTTSYVLANTAGVALTLSATSNSLDSLAGGGANGGIVRPYVTTGALTISLGGSGSTSFAGTVQDNGSATLAVQETGAGMQVFTAANTYSGATTASSGTLVFSGANGSALNSASVNASSGGTVLLDNSGAANGNRLASGVPVNLSGGTFSLAGNAATDTTQTVGALSFSRASTVSVTPAGTAAAQLVLASLTRQNNGTISLSDGGHVTATGLTNTNGIVGGYATVNGTDWARVDASGKVSAYTGYTSDLGSAASTDNLRLSSSGGTTSLGKTQSRNSLDLVSTGSTAATLDLGAGQTLSLTSGGLLTSGTAGQTLQNGMLKATGGELIVTNQNALTVSAVVADGSAATALTKSGAGTLALTGTNTYTGTTTVVQGTIQAATDANLGTGSAVALSGGTLQATASFTSAKSLQGSGGTLDTVGNNVAFNGGNNTGSLTKNGTGILSLTGVVSSATVVAGTLHLSNLATNNAASITLLGGRLEASGSGVNSVLSDGFPSAEISPGSIGQAATLTLTSLTVFSSTIVDFDLGSGTKDLLTISSNLFLAGSQVLFRFSDLGGTRTGTAYTLLNLPTFAGGVSVSNFAFDPASTAAGYKGAFSLTNNVLSVTFTAVPEPGVMVWLLCAGAVWAAWSRVRRKQRG